MIRTSRGTHRNGLRVALAMALLGVAAMIVPQATPAAAATGDLVITGVVDGPLTGGTPKAVEFYAVNDIADLSVYGFGSANNGGGSDGEEFTFPAVAATAGDYIHVASETTGFTSFFGFAPDYTSGAANINGDDAIELFQSGAVVDVFGDINVDGTGQPWEHTDGWAYRVDDTGQDGSTFALANWTFSGVDALDGETTNDTAATPFPIGTYAAAAVVPVDLVISGVVDGPLSGGIPKAVEFYAVNDIADLSVYGFGSANNGGGSDGEEFTFPAVAATAGDYIYVASEAAGFTSFFGFAPGYTSGAADINGDDAIELFQGGAVVDVFGDINVDGNGEPWEYTDGWAYRVDATGPDGSAFVLGNWTFSGVDALDGETTNDTAATPFPIGTYSTTPVVPLSFIHDVQGSGATVAISGPVKVDAIVTSLVTDNDALDGFLLQEEDADADADPATSEGILVTCEALCPAALAVGDNVTVAGDAGELFRMSEIDASVGGSVTINSSGNPLPIASPLALPAPDGTNQELTFEELEGMLVNFEEELFVSEYFELARFGQVVLSADERPFQFTHENLPSAAGYTAFLDGLAKRRIVLDDDNNNQNDAISGAVDEPYYYPVPGFSTTNKFRGGDSISGLTGALDWAFGEWRVNPTPEVFDYTFTPNNTRPATPDPVGGSLKVASFNVLNYFTTIDDGVNVCGPNLIGCRGANSAAELARQRDKIVSALVEIDADIVGLIEIENNADASLIDLVGGLNAVVGAGTYDYVDTGTIGGDAIKVAFIYKPATVDLAGGFEILDSSVDPTFIDTKNRPVLIQTFEETASGERATIAVNHLKSKGSSCSDVGDPGTGDGQANCNLTRTSAATALVNHLETDPTSSGDPDFLIIGDLNAYAMEDPIAAITGAGYTDLIDAFGGPSSYSFVFDGQLGYLDHALANPTLLASVTGVTEWHINADEVNVLDYNDDIQDPGEASFERKSSALPIYEANGFRSSDHDPLVIGLGLDSIPDNPTCSGLAATIIGTPGDDVIVGTNKSDVIMSFGGNDTIIAGNGDDVICAGYGDDVIDGGNGKDLIFGEEGDDSLAGGNGKDSLDGGTGTDDGDGGNGVDTCANLEAVINCEL